MPKALPAASLPGFIDVDGYELQLIERPGYLTVSTVLWGPIEVLKLHTTPDDWESFRDAVGVDAAGVSRLAATGVGLVCRLAAEPVSLTAWRRIIYTSAEVAGNGMSGWSLVADRGIDVHTAPAWSIYAAATASISRSMNQERREKWEQKINTPIEGERILYGFIDDDTAARNQPQRIKKPPKEQIQRDNAKALQQLKMMS